MLFIAIGASIRTFLNYLRPVLMIDAAHLKGLYKGTNLVAMAMVGNNQIVPIAFGICKGETGPCWSWWMSVLKECIGDNPNLLFISDRHAAIALAVEKEFPLAFHDVLLHHYGRFTSPHDREFVDDLIATIDPVDIDTFSANQVKLILTNYVGYDKNSPTFIYIKKPNCSLDSGLVPFEDAIQERDTILMYTHHNRLHVYVSRVELSPLVVAELFRDETNKRENQGKPSCAKKLFD
ncbi:transposase, MuDR, MULE transposase domain protein [Tanacetum coccineum]